MREPAVGEFGTGPAFVSKPTKTKKIRGKEHVVALRIDFVVKPGKDEKVRETIDTILENSFGGEREFLQALVLESESEVRLVTVITFWSSNGFAECRERRVNWLRQKLAQYLDQSLRVQTFLARVLGAKESVESATHRCPEESYPSITETFAALAS